jgi:SEC-C motif-containing protein
MLGKPIPRAPVRPKLLHSFVKQLCEKIVPGALPVQVPVKVGPNAQINECFLNVREQIARSGGRIQHGWEIMERLGLFIEGQFHAIWVAPEGALMDVTPKTNGDTETLFLPDPKETFDESSLLRRDNIRLAEYDHPIVHEFLRHAADVRKYEESCTNPNDPREMILDRDVYEPLLLRAAALEQQMIALPPERNGLCRCGSGKKFKRCCGARGA